MRNFRFVRDSHLSSNILTLLTIFSDQTLCPSTSSKDNVQCCVETLDLEFHRGLKIREAQRNSKSASDLFIEGDLKVPADTHRNSDVNQDPNDPLEDYDDEVVKPASNWPDPEIEGPHKPPAERFSFDFSKSMSSPDPSDIWLPTVKYTGGNVWATLSTDDASMSNILDNGASAFTDTIEGKVGVDF